MRPPPRIARAVSPGRRKPNERVRPKHREFVRRLPCLACGKPGPSECAHIRSSGDGGTGLRPADRFCLPLCGPAGCHHQQHQVGEVAFFAELGIDPLDICLALWTVTGEDDSGQRIIFRAQQKISLHRRPRP